MLVFVLCICLRPIFSTYICCVAQFLLSLLMHWEAVSRSMLERRALHHVIRNSEINFFITLCGVQILSLCLCPILLYLSLSHVPKNTNLRLTCGHF